jgi:hypothetical protein
VRVVFAVFPQDCGNQTDARSDGGRAPRGRADHEVRDGRGRTSLGRSRNVATNSVVREHRRSPRRAGAVGPAPRVTIEADLVVLCGVRARLDRWLAGHGHQDGVRVVVQVVDHGWWRPCHCFPAWPGAGLTAAVRPSSRPARPCQRTRPCPACPRRDRHAGLDDWTERRGDGLPTAGRSRLCRRARSPAIPHGWS